MKKLKKAITLLLSILMIFTLFSTSMTAFANEMPDETGFCGDNAQYALGQVSHKLTIFGSGEIADGFFQGRKDIESVLIKGDITSVGKNAFDGCTNIEEVDLGNVTSIGYCAFELCYKLKSVYSTNLEEIGAGAFNMCHRLEYTIPDTVKTIGNYAFSSCYCLYDVVIPDSVTNIGEGAFANCLNLETAVIPETLSKIGFAVFGGDISLRKLTNFSQTITCFSGDEDTPVYYHCALRKDAPLTTKHITDVLTILSEENCYSDDCDNLQSALDEIYEQTGVRYSSYSEFIEKMRSCIEENKIPDYLEVECKEKSAQHDQCVSDGINHSIFYVSENLKSKDCDLKCSKHLEIFKNEDIAPNCVTVGYKGGTVCLVCAEKDDEERIAASVIEPAHPYGEIQPHTPVLLPGDEPTCSRPGYSDFTACAICRAVLVEPELVPPTDHIDEDGDGLCDYCEMPVGEKPESKTFIEIIAEFLANAFSRILSIFKKIFG